MNEIQALQEELNLLKADFAVHKQETERTITMLEILIARLLAANIRADVMTEAECARLLNQLVSTHSRPKAAGCGLPVRRVGVEVSTHSRPKAAGPVHKQTVSFGNSFNTQPPEGGW